MTMRANQAKSENIDSENDGEIGINIGSEIDSNVDGEVDGTYAHLLTPQNETTNIKIDSANTNASKTDCEKNSIANNETASPSSQPNDAMTAQSENTQGNDSYKSQIPDSEKSMLDLYLDNVENEEEEEKKKGAAKSESTNSDAKPKKKKKSWKKRLFNVLAVLVLGVVSGTMLASWYKNTLKASTLDYAQYHVEDYMDNTSNVVALAVQKDNPTDSELKNFVSIAKSKNLTPQNFTASQNYIMAIYKASLATSYEAIGDGLVDTIAKQTVHSERRFDGNEYSVENISCGILKVANRASIEKGSNMVTAIIGENITNTSASWTGKKTTYKIDDFKDLTGDAPSSLLPYIVSSKTVLNDNAEIKKETLDDKTVYVYEMSLHKIYSVLKYQKQVKYQSGLSDSPVFDDIKIKIIIDDEWNLVRTEIVEHYTVVYGIPAKCTGTLTTNYNFTF